MNPFDYYYEQVKSKGDLNLDPTWGQGKTTYGGMSAALGLAAIERDLTAQRDELSPLRSISVHFCGALNTQTPFTTDTRVLKAGSSVVNIARKSKPRASNSALSRLFHADHVGEPAGSSSVSRT